MIYADNAATTALDAEAFAAMKPYLRNEYGNASPAYSFARPAKKALRNARETIAQCIGAQPEEIYFTSGGTESDNWAIKGMTYGDDGDSKNESGSNRRAIITTQIEHHAILHSCAAVERSRYSIPVPIQYLPVNAQGILPTATLQSAVTDGTKLVSVILANNEIGTIEPIADLAAIAHQRGAYFHTDAVQAVGHIPVDVQALGVDMLSASAHKFNGPKGIGFLYCRKGVPLRPLVDGGAQEFRMRAGTENIAAIVAMASALRKNCEQMSETAAKLRRMEEIFFSVFEASASPIVFLRNGTSARIPGNISLSIRGASGERLLHRMDLKGICIATGSACDSVHTQISHVIRAIGVPEEYARGTIRISFGRENIESDAQTVALALVDILTK